MKKLIFTLFVAGFMGLFGSFQPVFAGDPGPSYVTLTPNSTTTGTSCSPTHMTAQLFDDFNSPITEGVTYDWSMSSTPGSVGTFENISGNTADFRPLTPGTAHIWVTAWSGETSLGSSATVVVDSTSCATSSSSNTSTSTNFSPATAPVCTNEKPKTPQIIHVIYINPTTVQIQWTPVATPVDSYLISYGRASGVAEYGNPRVSGERTSSIQISHLDPNSRYYFRVRALNGCMPGEYSNESTTPVALSVQPTPEVLAESTPAGELTPTAASTQSATPVAQTTKSTPIVSCQTPSWNTWMLVALISSMLGCTYMIQNGKTYVLSMSGLSVVALISTLTTVCSPALQALFIVVLASTMGNLWRRRTSQK